MSDAYHEPIELLSSETRDMHRAILSLAEELQAIDWYQQRVDACADQQLKDVLLHNKNEEIEHSAMLMEWIRRHTTRFDGEMRKYIFTELDIVGIESETRPRGSAVVPSATLGIESMRGK